MAFGLGAFLGTIGHECQKGRAKRTHDRCFSFYFPVVIVFTAKSVGSGLSVLSAMWCGGNMMTADVGEPVEIRVTRCKRSCKSV